MAISKKVILIGSGLVVVASLGGWMISRSLVERASPVPVTLGVEQGRLAPCPDTPNCVSTQADDAEHSLDPVPYTMPLTETRTLLLEIVDSLPRTDIAMTSSTYIHAVSRSPTFGFIDDTEIFIDEEANLIHIRAAARLGQSDMGVNRSRAEEILETFQAMSQ